MTYAIHYAATVQQYYSEFVNNFKVKMATTKVEQEAVGEEIISI
jgi:hypothetical protein